MKIVGTCFSLQTLQEMANLICPKEGEVKSAGQGQYLISAKGMQMTLEQSGPADPLTEALLYGEIDLPLSIVDIWVDSFKTQLVGGQFDIHADEARLVRRYSC